MNTSEIKKLIAFGENLGKPFNIDFWLNKEKSCGCLVGWAANSPEFPIEITQNEAGSNWPSFDGRVNHDAIAAWLGITKTQSRQIFRRTPKNNTLGDVLELLRSLLDGSDKPEGKIIEEETQYDETEGETIASAIRKS